MKKLLVPYFTAGYPEKAWFAPILRALDDSGADIIEIGVPFSDPIADGPTIQAASQRALENGTSVKWILGEVKRIRPQLKAELIFFSYYNPLASIAATLEEAAQAIANAGFHGVLVPDLALEGATHLIAALKQAGLHYIPLIAPTTTEARLRMIAPHATSFAYGVSVTGVTGARAGVSVGLQDYLKRVRSHFKQFVVGFGISTPEDAAKIATQADGVVLGSALVRIAAQATDEADAVTRLTRFMQGIRKAIDAS